jgi:phage terminase large subunit-like protein
MMKPTYVLDVLRSWQGKQSPLNSDKVLDEIAGLAKRYHLEQIITDQYSVAPISDAMRRRDVVMRGQTLTNELKADLFGTLKRNINTGQVELLDHDQLVSELTYLEIRPTPSGKPRIAAAGGKHDDHPMAVATVDDGVAMLADRAKEAEGERPEITIRYVHHQ